MFFNGIPGKVQKDNPQTYKIHYSKGTKIPHTCFCFSYQKPQVVQT